MAITVTHAQVLSIADDPNASAKGEVLPSDWNANHSVIGNVDLPTTGSAAVFNDGASQPIGNSVYGLPAFYDSGTDTTWFCWEGFQLVQGNTQRVAEVATFNHTTRVWAGNYVAGTQTLSNDPHGVMIPCADSAGDVWAVYGAHNSALQVNKIGTLSGGPLNPPLILPQFGTAVTFPNLFSVGTRTLYLFYNTTGTGTGQQEAIAVVKGTTSATGIVWGTPQSVFDSANLFTSQPWLPIGQGKVVGTKIHLVFTYAVGIGGPGQSLYYAIYDTTNGTVSNYAGSHSDVIGSQPVSLATLEANYKIYSGSDLYFPGFDIDSNNNPHVAIVSNGLGNEPTSIIALDGNGSSFAATTIYQYTVNAGALANDSDGVGVVARGTSVDVYFSDCLQRNGSSTAGNIRKVTFNGSSWGASSLVQSFGTFGLDVPARITNGKAEARVIWSEVSPNNISEYGNLLGFIYGDNGFLSRPQGYNTIAGVGTGALDPSNTNSKVTLSSMFGVANIGATVSSAGAAEGESRSTTSHSSGKYYLEFYKTKLAVSGGDFAIGFCVAAFDTVGGGHFLGGDTSHQSVGWFGDGRVFINNVVVTTIATLGVNNTLEKVGLCLDLTNNKLWIGRGNSDGTISWNNDVIANQNPATNTGGVDISSVTANGALFFAIDWFDVGDTGFVNFGQFPYYYGPPVGFSNW